MPPAMMFALITGVIALGGLTVSVFTGLLPAGWAGWLLPVSLVLVVVLHRAMSRRS